MMQVTEYQGQTFREMFEASTQEELIEKMDKRLVELKGEGHELVERKPVFEIGHALVGVIRKLSIAV